MLNESVPISEKRTKKHLESEELCPKRAFKDVFKNVMQRKSPPPALKRKNVFDLSSQNDKKSKEEKKKKNPDPQNPIQGQTVSYQEIPIIELSSFSTDLSVQMQELLEKMVDKIYLESENGISTTTVTIVAEDPLSLFNGSEIVIEHYDTAPHSFNIQLSGTMQAINEFALHLPTLQTQLTERLANFQIQLLPPILTEREQLGPEKTRKTKRGKKDQKIKKIPS